MTAIDPRGGRAHPELRVYRNRDGRAAGCQLR